MSPTSLNRPIVEKVCIYNSLCVCVCVGGGGGCGRGGIFQTLSPRVILKMRSRSPKSNQFLSLPQKYSCTSLVKMHPFILEIGCRKAIFQQSENGVKVTKI